MCFLDWFDCCGFAAYLLWVDLFCDCLFGCYLFDLFLVSFVCVALVLVFFVCLFELFALVFVLCVCFVNCFGVA